MSKVRTEINDDVLENVNGGYLMWNQDAEGKGEIWIYHIDENGNPYNEPTRYKFTKGAEVEAYIAEHRATMGDKTILGNLYKKELISL